MIIGVDAACLGVTDKRLKAGVYHFAVNLMQNLLSIDRKNKYLLYSFYPISKDLLKSFGPNACNRVLTPKKGWLNLRLSLEFLLRKPDIFLGLSQALPFYHPVKSFVYVHDLAFELYPQFYPGANPRLSRQTKFAVKNADRIVAVSNATKNDLTRLYGVDPRKIAVIYHGVEDRFKPGLLKVLPQIPYFLFVGSYKPGKNIPTIIKAFRLFLKNFKKPCRLVIAGSDYWEDTQANKLIKELNLEKQVKIAGFVREDELPRLYRGATAFVSPSFYEGFGMPILEALASGVPVITSPKGSITEIVGDAALLVDPEDYEGLGKAMLKVATDDKLRDRMIEKGLEKSKQFSWQKSAKELFNLYENIRNYSQF